MLEALARLLLIFQAVATLKDPILSLIRHGPGGEGGDPRLAVGGVPFFIFGDSLWDSGNNNYLKVSDKANHWPYGETFFRNATGRFCDGRIPPDFIAENANLPFIKPYLDPNFTDYTFGANFASAGAGVLPETCPGTLYLELQVSFFEDVTKQLRQQKGDSVAEKLISRAVYYLGMGGNDYVTLGKDSKESNATLTPHIEEVFVGWVIGNLTTSIKKLYALGGRKFLFPNVAPMGCMPGNRFATGTDECWDDLNVLAQMHNEALSRVLVGLDKDLPGFKYGVFDYYTTMLDRITSCTDFGFEVGLSACCGSGAYNGNSTCGIQGDYFTLCPNPNEFVYFDAAHPTEATNRQLSSMMWSGNPPVMSPRNLKSLFQDHP
ncbi:hypothetical protein MLD38_029525 [Melastoma candidum]|uniref:Uncharacterized protein n=1 Tax=Melastoma candidum TaxID=119954 RepID=A0ACB9N404_9MYRT|nr:hypothetical protein MLD38_029525 [Melastoma candidum]